MCPWVSEDAALLAAGDVSRGGEEQGETDVFAGYEISVKGFVWGKTIIPGVVGVQ